jgi:hypothetical protein
MTMAQPNAALVDALVALDCDDLDKVVAGLLEHEPRTPKLQALFDALYDKMEAAGLHARVRTTILMDRASALQAKLRQPATLSPL